MSLKTSLRPTGRPVMIACSFFLALAGADAAPKPKYGPETTRLFHSHAYIQDNPAPDYWALMPYYVPQENDRSCSVAAATMIVNAMRASRPLTADDELVTHTTLLNQTKSSLWKQGVGPVGRGITLDQLSELLPAALKAFGVEEASATVIRAESLSDEVRAQLRLALKENEKSSSDLIVANFDQKVFTEDTQVGHFAPVAAYDESARKVLIFDPDRKWYEPYWVPEELFFKALATKDSATGKNRGILWIKARPSSAKSSAKNPQG